jgi:two-component system CheB/CheR fusion protein
MFEARSKTAPGPAPTQPAPPPKTTEAELALTREELAAQVESLTQLHELAMKLGGILELQPALEAVLETAVRAQGAQFGILWLHDDAHGDLVAQASVGFDAQDLLAFARVTPGPRGGGSGNAYAQRRHWIIEDTRTDPTFEDFRQAAEEAGFRAVHSTPIVTRAGAVLGALSVHFQRPHRPSRRDMQLADVCARHAADSIEHHRSRQALSDSEQLYRAIGESIEYGVFVCDAEGRNLYQSESFLRLVGRSAEEIRGFGWTELLHPDDAAGYLERWHACARRGGAWNCEQRVRGADGQWHPILVRAVPVRDARGEIARWAGICLDISEMKKVEGELRELDRRKDEFLATLAHELRNPLAPLRNGLEVLRRAGEDAETSERARCMMERQLGQMVRLVDDLLDVSRVSRGKIELRCEQAELTAILRSAIETSEPLMKERGHQLVVRFAPQRVTVNADVVRLAQVFWNLLNNAARYTEPGGHIALSVEAAAGEACVRVRDDGIGIPPEMQERIFDIFTQVDRTLERAQGGLGIGLSIAKRLVEMHGGTIGVHSEGHRLGTEFVVRLPAHIDVASPCLHRILVADDNVDSAATLSLMLEVMGNEVRVAHDGREAVELADTFRPDSILMDIGMPKMNGYDACARIRALPWAKEVFMVALTGWGQDEDRIRAAMAGFDRHLVKPVEPRTLERLLQALPQGAPARG